MKIRKFNESTIETRKFTNIDEYFYDLIDEGDWSVKLIESTSKSESEIHLPRIYITSNKVQKWFNREPHLDILTNWAISSTMDRLEESLDIRKDQVNSMELISKCVKHYAESNNFDIIDFRYSSVGPNNSYPVDTIIVNLR